MWANGAFRGVGSNSSSKDYPYIDFSSNYYNPSGQLLDYSSFDINGLSGESFSFTYSSSATSQRWWDNANIGTSYTYNVNRIIKYITFNINMPYLDDINGSGSSAYFNILLNNGNISHDNNPNGDADGYWVFHNEKNGTNQTGQYDGQRLRSTTSGIGSWVNNKGYLIRNASANNALSGFQSIIQISIGLPSNLNKNIEKVHIEFIKG